MPTRNRIPRAAISRRNLLEESEQQVQRTTTEIIQSVQSDAASTPDEILQVDRVAISNVALTGNPTVDGGVVSDGQRLMLTGQTAGAENGIWEVYGGGGSWRRVYTDKHTTGRLIYVKSGSEFSASIWALTTTGTITVGTTALAFKMESVGVGFASKIATWDSAGKRLTYSRPEINVSQGFIYVAGLNGDLKPCIRAGNPSASYNAPVAQFDGGAAGGIRCYAETGTLWGAVYGKHNSSLGYGQLGTSVAGVRGDGNGGSADGGYFSNTNGRAIYSETTSGNSMVSRSASGRAVDAVVTGAAATATAAYHETQGVGYAEEAYCDNASNSGAVRRTHQDNSSSAADGHEIVVDGTGNNLWLIQTKNGTATTTTENFIVAITNGTRVARVDNTGKGFFNGGTQNSGADIAELVEVQEYVEPGDVLVISDGYYSLCDEVESSAVAGVVATKPGIILTPHDVDDLRNSQMVPLALRGTVPVKVTDEGGKIKPGDILVCSSTRGHAMRGEVDSPASQIIGKALETWHFGKGVIKALV